MQLDIAECITIKIVKQLNFEKIGNVRVSD